MNSWGSLWYEVMVSSLWYEDLFDVLKSVLAAYLKNPLAWKNEGENGKRIYITGFNYIGQLVWRK